MTTTTRKADRVNINRAPKGGAVSPVNGQFYKGGRFMPMASTPVEFKPAPLIGSSRQVAWATRLRAEALVRLEDEIQGRRLFITGTIKTQADASRKSIKPFLIARHNLMVERSAASIIDRRAELAR